MCAICLYMNFFTPNLPVTLKKTKCCEALLLWDQIWWEYISNE